MTARGGRGSSITTSGLRDGPMRAPKSACASSMLPAAVAAEKEAVERVAASIIQAHLLVVMAVLLLLAFPLRTANDCQQFHDGLDLEVLRPVSITHPPEGSMFDYNDLFQWERFITPSIIKVFYWLAIGMSALFGLSGIISGFALMSLHPLAGLLWVIASLIGIGIGVMFARIVSEFILIMFRINEHLGAIRQRGSQMTDDR
jgi:hypothetical protein